MGPGPGSEFVLGLSGLLPVLQPGVPELPEETRPYPCFSFTPDPHSPQEALILQAASASSGPRPVPLFHLLLLPPGPPPPSPPCLMGWSLPAFHLPVLLLDWALTSLGFRG